MSIALSVIIPALLAILYLVYIDRYKMEPWKKLFKAVGFGMLSVIPALILEIITDPILCTSAAGMAASAGLCEEAAKLFFLWLVIRKNVDFDEHIDGIIYATCVGIGFTLVENVEYFLADYTSIDGRVLMPGHYIYAIVMGYFLSKAHFATGTDKKIYGVLTFIVPAFLHWVWDFILMAADVIAYNDAIAIFMMVIFIAFYIGSIIYSVKLVKRQTKKDAAVREAEKAKEIERIKAEAIAEYLQNLDNQIIEETIKDDELEEKADLENNNDEKLI